MEKENLFGLDHDQHSADRKRSLELKIMFSLKYDTLQVLMVFVCLKRFK